ncbi:hypothetical protein AAFC00_003548 [Neodothiora populina]|uniref:JmjC domain-containing protein n=1 Tax=Neodothiora populina TaxID=2781224 RepID=A0ABR3PEL3_9PEZI
MPAQRPRAAFEPIPPDLDINALVEHTPNFQYADRISCEEIARNGIEEFERLVQHHVINRGYPLVIDGYENLLDPWTFTPKWLRDNVGSKVEQSRNLATKDYLPLSIAHYLNNMGKLANQFFENPRNYKDKTRQRIYLKDIDCPQVWHDKLQEHMPPSLFYLNDSTGEPGGPGSTLASRSNLPGRRMGRGIARAGDLMSSLPPAMRAENLMCYVGHEGTYTPAHREMCASLGHNIMVEASADVGEDGKPEKPGSSIWFMTESKDRNTVSEYWLSVLGHDIEVESHFAQISAWKKAPFNVFVVDQRPGDFILIPPLAPHQVWNRGTRTMKVAWNRTTVETLQLALNEALPKARIVCRDEQYKNKAIVYYTLMKYSSLLSSARAQAEKLPKEAASDLMNSYKIKQLSRNFKQLLVLFKQIMLSEMFSPDGPQERCEYLPFDSNVTCAYCRGNILNRFLSCPSCKDALGHEEGEPYDVCMDCYAMGRSCGCISNLKWTEQFKWKELVQKYESWRKLYIDLDGGNINVNKTPWTLAEERALLPHKTLAEVCREQLKRRPWVDINKPKERKEDEESEEDIIVDDEGRVKKTVKKRPKMWLKTHSPCHVCCKRHPNWKSAKCTTCDRWWCYGSLFRGADMMPLDIMQNPQWSCPHCMNVCFAGACRKDPKQIPIEPKGTLLGHDTKKVADARSVECLVDFSVSNLTWLRDDEDAVESARIRRAREEAQRAKAADPRMVDDDDDEEEEEGAAGETQVQFEYSPDGIPSEQRPGQAVPGRQEAVALDPALRSESDLLQSLSHANESLPPSSAMLQGHRPIQRTSSTMYNPVAEQSFVPAGYAPAMTSGFVAPSAIMYQTEEATDGYAYPDPEEAAQVNNDDAQPQESIYRPFKPPGKKRTRDGDEDDQINMDAAPKKRRAADETTSQGARPRNEATVQYEKEKERKALDEAKKQGRFIAVQAALKGRKRVVKLKLSGSRLAHLVAPQASSAAQHPAEPTADNDEGDAPDETVLLRSDVVPATEKARKGIMSSKAKIRVEKDEDFSMRSDRQQRANAKRRRNPVMDYEEVDLGSEDGSEDNIAEDISNTNNGSRTVTNGKRRISSYIQKKHQNDPDLPDELPENYKDTRPNRSQPSNNTPRTTSKKRKSVGGPRRSAAREPSSPISEDQQPEPRAFLDLTTDSPATTVSIQEANRLAKLQALSLVDDSVSESSPAPSSHQIVEATIEPSKHLSIFDKKRKKKVKIVGASSAKQKAQAKVVMSRHSRGDDDSSGGSESDGTEDVILP